MAGVPVAVPRSQGDAQALTAKGGPPLGGRVISSRAEESVFR